MGASQSDNQKKALIKNKEDLEKYQNFDQYQQEQDAQHQQNQGSNVNQIQQQQLNMREVPLQADQQQIVDNPNWNQLQNENKVQVQPFEVQQPVIQDQIQNQEIYIKIQEAQKSLLLMIVNQICEIICFIWMSSYYTEYYKKVGPGFLYIFIPLYLISISLSNCESFRKLPKSIFLNFMILYFSSSVQIYSCSFFSDYRPPEEEGLYFTHADIIILAFLFLMLFKIITQILIFIYLYFEKNEIRLKIFSLYLIGFCVLTLSYSFWFLPQIIISFFYGICLMISIKQSFAGRFKLKLKNVIAMTNCYYFGITFPCWIFI